MNPMVPPMYYEIIGITRHFINQFASNLSGYRAFFLI